MNRPATVESSRAPKGLRYPYHAIIALILLFITFVPHYYLPPVEIALGGLSVPVLKYFPMFLVVALSGTWAARMFMGGWSLSWSRFDTLILVFLSITLVSAIKAEHVQLALAKSFYYFATGAFLYFAVGNAGWGKSEIRGSIGIFAGLCFILAAYGIVEYVAREDFVYGDLFVRYNPYHKGTERIGSFVGNPVVLGAYLTLGIPLCLHHMYSEERGNGRLLKAGMCLIVLLCAVMTFSRGAWLSISIGACIYMIPKVGAMSLRRAFEHAIVATVVALLMIPVFSTATEAAGIRHAQERAELRFAARARSLFQVYGTESFRIAQYRTTLGIIKNEPLLGIGFGNFTTMFERYKDETTPSKRVSDATTTENMFLMVLCELGLVGFGATAMMFGWLLYSIWVNYRHCVNFLDRDLSLAFLASFSGFFINMISWDGLNHPGIRILFWLLAGLAMRHGVLCARPPRVQGGFG